MIYIFEGMDNCLKDTIIGHLRGHLPPDTHVIKYSSPPATLKAEEYQKKHFKDMFDLLEVNLNTSNRNLILNRAHLGEYVYAPIYRNYQASWIFDLEKEFLKIDVEHCSKIMLILLYDSNNDDLVYREDGKSLSKAQVNNFDAERSRFIEAFEKSNFKNKVKLDLSNFSINGKSQEEKINVADIVKQILYTEKNGQN